MALVIVLLVNYGIEIIGISRILSFWIYVFQTVFVLFIEFFTRHLLLYLWSWVRINDWLFLFG